MKTLKSILQQENYSLHNKQSTRMLTNINSQLKLAKKKMRIILKTFILIRVYFILVC